MSELNSSSLLSDVNLKAYYRFNSGVLTTDSSGNSRTLTNNNTVGETASGKYGYCADFGNPNTTKYFSRAEDFWGGGAASFSAWIKMPDPTGTHEFFLLNDATQKKQLYCHYDGTNLFLTQYRVGVGYNAAQVACTITANKWHHIACTFAGDGGAMLTYLDGTQVGTGTATAGNGTIDQTDQYYIGNGPAGSEMEGYMDDVAFFNDVLTATEVKVLSRNYSPALLMNFI